MANVQLPDGSVVAFPDNMPDAAINTAIQQHLAGNQPTGSMDTFADKATHMMSFGLDKPANAAGLSAIDYAMGKGKYGDLYDKNLAQQNAVDQVESEQHPYASAAGNATGLVGSMGIAVPSTGAIPATLWQGIKAAAPANAAMGGAIGGLNALGNAKGDAGDRLQSGVEGAALGAGAGVIMPAALQTIGTGISKIATPLIEKFTAEPGDMATKKLAQAMMRDNITPEQAQIILQNSSPAASIADVGGENTQGLARSIINSPGAGKADATNFLIGRQTGAGTRVQDMVKAGFGTNAEFNDTANNLIAARHDAAAPLYQKAFAENQNVQSPTIDRILQTPAGQSALKAAGVKMQNDMSLMGVNDPELMEQAQLTGQYVPGSGGVASGLKLRTLDYVKRALDDQIGTAQRAGENDNVRILSGLKSSLVGAMDSADSTATKNSPGLYSQARAAFSGPSQSKDALEMGRNFMNEDAQVSANDIAKLDPGDRKFFQIGAARAISDKAAANPNAAIKNITSNDLWKQKLQAAMPSEGDYQDFIANVRNESNMGNTKNAILGNSTTTKQLGEVADSGVDMGHLMEVAKGNYAGAAMKVGTNILKKVTGSGLSETERQMLAKQMFSSDQGQNTQNLQALAAMLQGKPRTQGIPLPGVSGQLGQLIGSTLARNGQ